MNNKYLVINGGSSSLKFSLYEMPSEKLIANGNIERIGLNKGDSNNFILKKGNEKFVGKKIVTNHGEAFDFMKEQLLDNKCLESLDEIKGVGHRVLHGGALYSDSTIIDSNVISDIEDLTALGPLHHPGQLAGIKGSLESLKNTPMVAVFDTAFHQTIPEENYLFPIPYSYYEDYGVRKYGFHGTSHQYITEVMQKKLNKKDVNLIICHIGSGASITAIKDGVSFDTTMGLTPNAGLMMCTRTGTIEPDVLEYISRQTGKSLLDLMIEMNKNSGLLGVSGVSNDYRDVLKEASNGNERCKLAISMLVNSAVSYIASYYAKLEGNLDGIIFTAGIGENACDYREMVINKCSKFMPLKLNPEKNNQTAGFKDVHEGIISSFTSSIPVYVIPTNEEIMIARSTYDLVNKTKVKRR